MVNGKLLRAAKQLTDHLDQSDWVRIAGALCCITIAGLLTSAPAFLMGRAVNEVMAAQGVIGIYVWNLLWPLIAVVVGYEVIQICRKWLVESVAVKLQESTQVKYAVALLQAQIDALHGRHIGEVITQIDKGVAGLVKLMKLALLEFGPALVTAFVSVALVVAQDWKVGAAMIAVIFINFTVTAWQIHSQSGIRVRLLERRMEFNGRLGELIMNLESVRACGIATEEEADFRKISGNLRETEFVHHWAMMRFDALKGLSDGGGLVVVLSVSLWFLSKGTLSSGDILTIGLLYQNATAPLKMLHRVVDESHEAAIHVVKADSLQRIGIDPGLLGREAVGQNDCPHAFKASNLSCDLPNGRPVLRELSYTVPRQTFDLISGETGAGKSTLLRVMLGLNASYAGYAHVLGTEVREADKKLLSRQVCYVAQLPFVKAGSLRSNLALGLGRDTPDLELIRAAKLAGLPIGEGAWVDGLDSKIAERGEGLSGGEKQRIALARIFLSEAELLILDEATSQLDEKMEAYILDNVTKELSHKAIVMVAHRGSTLKWAKRIFKLESGQLRLVSVSE